MWISKFRVYDEEGVYSKIARELKTEVYGYPLNYYFNKKYYYFVAIGFVSGEIEKKNKFIKKLKKDKRVHKLEENDSFFICITKEKLTKGAERFVHLFYNPLIIRLKPSIIYKDGWEENEIACFDRKIIEEIIHTSEKKYNLKLNYIKQAKIKNVGILNILPELTEKQKGAIEKAVQNGYYQYPRKIDVQNLAKISKLSFSTFQEHLRRAENKLIPFAVKKL